MDEQNGRDQEYEDSAMQQQGQEQLEVEGQVENSSNQNEEVAQFEILALKIKLLPIQVQDIYKNISKLTQLNNYLTIPTAKNITKEVCAKIIKYKETTVQCFDCGKDSSCIICLDCFKGGNHEGHRYVVKTAHGGCCDCGDVEAWSEQGFCEKHSGKFEDFKVDEKDYGVFKQKMQGLFYMYFWLTLNKHASAHSYFRYLLKYLKDLNTDNLYNNKLLALVLCQPLPQPYTLNSELNKKTILYNLLTTNVTQTHVKDWFELFITMFSYYPFKQSILAHYISNFGLIVDGRSKSTQSALTISCQLLTSFKLVQQYALQNKIGLGHDMRIPQVSRKLFNYYITLMTDICNITKLSENAPLAYFRMHINHQYGINNTLMYYDFLMKRINKFYKNYSETQLMVKFIKFPTIERQTIWNFVDIIKNVKVEQPLLVKIIKSLWKKIQKMNNRNQQTLCCLRPYQRCFSIALFAYFDCSLQTIPSRKQALVNSVLSTTISKFEQTCSSILSRQFYTLFFYSKTQAYSGLGQTCYNYLYYYTINNKILANTDLLSIKIMILLLERSQVLGFQSIIGADVQKMKDQNERKEKISYLAHVLKIFRYLLTHQIPEIFIANGVNPQSTAFIPQLKHLFISVFKQHKNSISFEDLKTKLLDLIQFPQTKSSKNWLQQFCTINKQNKMYSLRTVFEEQMVSNIGINYDDLWLGEASQDPFGDIKKSLKFVNVENGNIFRYIWNKVNIVCLESIIKNMLLLSEDYGELSQVLNFYTFLYSINKANKLGCMFDQKIVTNSKGTIPNHILTELQLATKTDEVNQIQNQEKQKAEEVKRKKKLQMQRKRLRCLQGLGKFDESQSCCYICKNKLNQNSVLLVSLSIRNHQKLLNLGPGLQCLSLNSCSHIFDYECIMKQWKNERINDNVSCPLCQFQSNLLMPASLKYDKKIAQKTFQRIMKILELMGKGIKYEEVVKSFYHYFLICMVNFEKSVEKKGLVYQILLDLICKNIKEDEFKILEKNLYEQKFLFHFKTYLRQDQNRQKNQTTLEALTFLITGQQANENANKDKDPIKIPQKDKQCWNKQNIVSQNFKNVIHRILCHIKENGKHLHKQHEQSSRMEQEHQNSFIDIFMTTLTNPQFHIKDLPQSILQIQNLHILQPQPSKYSDISSRKCSQCSEITQDLILCLLCNWQGCQDCENSKALTHINKTHGSVGAIMSIQKATVYYVSGERSVYAGKVYENVFLSKLQRSGDWQNFLLNQSILSQIQKKILLDDLPTRKLQEPK